MNEQEAQERLRKASERDLGKFGEAVWKNVFMGSSIRYVPLCNIEDGGAPLMKGGDDAVILPDFSINGAGFAAYLDSKCKRNVVLWRLGNQLRHGIDRRNYEAYQTAGYLDRRGCGLGIIELFTEKENERWSGSLLVETFRNLGRPIAGFSNQDHMVYWPRKMFVDLDSLTALELFDLAEGRKRRTYKDEITKTFSAAEPVKNCGFGNHKFHDVQEAGGRIKSVCAVCGKFYGYKQLLTESK